jgi:uncharacterized protein (DUF488 family)
MDGQYEGWEIFTIGHSNVTSDRLIELLQEHHIQTLVDVRSSPYSQWAHQFNRETLAQRLGESGIQYAYLGDSLGGRPKDPTCYKTGEVPQGKANYLELVDYLEVARRPWYQAGIKRLLALADESRVVVMCSEEDPSHCHRHHLISQTLLELGVAVWHIRATGALERALTLAEEAAAKPEEPQQLSLFDEI